MVEKNRLRPPEFGIRANQFIHHVNGAAMNLKRQRQGLINLILEKSLSVSSDRYDALSEASPQFFSRSQELDQKTVDFCLVSIQAVGEVKHLRQFVREVNKIAARLGGVDYSDFMNMLQTTDVSGEIHNINDKEGRLPSFHNIFT